jgi:hypothetical protein
VSEGSKSERKDAFVLPAFPFPVLLALLACEGSKSLRRYDTDRAKRCSKNRIDRRASVRQTDRQTDLTYRNIETLLLSGVCPLAPLDRPKGSNGSDSLDSFMTSCHWCATSPSKSRQSQGRWQVERQRSARFQLGSSSEESTTTSQQLLLVSSVLLEQTGAQQAPYNRNRHLLTLAAPEHPCSVPHLAHHRAAWCPPAHVYKSKNMNPPTSSFVLSYRPLSVAEAEEAEAARGSLFSAVPCPPREGRAGAGAGGGFCAAATEGPTTTPSKAKEDEKGIVTTNQKERRSRTMRGSRNFLGLSKVNPTRPNNTDEEKRSKSPPLSPAALCRQHTDVSALTWDDGGGGDSPACWMLHAGSPPPLPVRQPTLGLGAQIMQPSHPPPRASADAQERPSLGRRAAAAGGLIDDDDDERSVEHTNVVALTTSTTAQPPKMPVRKVSGLAAGASRNRTRVVDLCPLSSSVPPTLPLRQATLNTVATADSTALASHTIQESTERRHESERVGSNPRADADVARTLLTRLTHHPRATDGPGTAHAIRHGADDSDAHPPIMPVRQRSLLAHVEPTAAAERLPSDSCDHRVFVAGGRPWGCSAPRATTLVPVSLGEGPPHPPSRKASG